MLLLQLLPLWLAFGWWHKSRLKSAASSATSGIDSLKQSDQPYHGALRRLCILMADLRAQIFALRYYNVWLRTDQMYTYCSCSDVK